MFFTKRIDIFRLRIGVGFLSENEEEAEMNEKIRSILNRVAFIMADGEPMSSKNYVDMYAYWCTIAVHKQHARENRDDLLKCLLDIPVFLLVLMGDDNDIMDFFLGKDSSVSILKAAEKLYPELTRNGVFLPCHPGIRRIAGNWSKGIQVRMLERSCRNEILKLFAVGEVLGFWRFLRPYSANTRLLNGGMDPERDQIRIMYPEPDQGGDELRRYVENHFRVIDEGDARS